jgi:dynein heavy chain, axonemal
MLPTPAKFHYLFNMRELSKIFQGIILATRDRFNKTARTDDYGGNVSSPAGYLLALWLHECRRVFCDKLTSHDDKEWVDTTIFKLMNESCPADVVTQVRSHCSLLQSPASAVTDLPVCQSEFDTRKWVLQFV